VWKEGKKNILVPFHLISQSPCTPSPHTCTLCFPRYDLYDIEISPCEEYDTVQGTHYVPAGYYYINVTVDEMLFEGGRSVR